MYFFILLRDVTVSVFNLQKRLDSTVKAPPSGAFLFLTTEQPQKMYPKSCSYCEWMNDCQEWNQTEWIIIIVPVTFRKKLKCHPVSSFLECTLKA